MLRETIRVNHLPDYLLLEEAGDMIRVTPRSAVVAPAGPAGPPLSVAALEQARVLIPGADVYALEADWRAVWAASGRPPLRSVDKAFLGWVAKRAGAAG
jgi:hypothetical protein